VIGGQVLGEGAGRSKKVAEQRAAATAYARILNDNPALDVPSV
jgi:dsRNA-specific ribonuclease